MDFHIGTDPEFILIDQKNNLKSAIDVIRHGRHKKIKINKSLFFYDNVLAECSIEPSKDPKQFEENIRESLKTLSKIISPLRISDLCSGHFLNSEMTHTDARLSGCSVEYCAYSLETIDSNKIKKFFKNSNFRTAGGHVHLGTNLGKDDINSVMLVRMLDLFLGTTCLFLENSNHHFERRKIYGQLGRYRQPAHGIEYRTPSNFWLMSPVLVKLICEICEFCIKFVEQKKYELFWKVDLEKLDSDDFWNNDGDPSTCHICFGYDVELLQDLSNLDKNNLMKKIKPIQKITDCYLPNNIKSYIKSILNKKYNLYKEWAL